MKFNEWIYNYRKTHGLSMQAMGDLCGLSKQYISVLEKGINPNTKKEFIPSIETIRKISEATNTDFSELFSLLDNDQLIKVNDSFPTFENILPIKKKNFPLLGDIAAGKPIEAIEQIETYVPEDESLNADYALRVKGDSMIEADINDGDIVFIRQQPDVENGEIAAVYVDGAVTLKRVYKDERGVTLNSANYKYPPMLFTAENCEEFRILGKAVKKLSDIK